MNRDRIGHFGGADDGGHVQIRQRRLRRSDANRLVRQQHVLGIEIRGRVHRHGLDTEFAAGAQNAKRNLAAISDDDFFDHRRYSMMNSGWPELDWLTVLGEYRGHAPRLVGFDLVHHLHRFDDAQYLSDLDLHADLDEGFGSRRGGRVISAHHRRGHRVLVVARLVLAGRRRRRCRRQSRRGLAHGAAHGRRGRHGEARMTADAHGFLALGNLQLRNTRLFQQLDQFFYFANIHPRTP